MLLELQGLGVAVVVLIFTVLLNCVDRKFVPAITIDEPTAPVLGVRLVMTGVPVARGRVICESKLPLRVPSISTSPLKDVEEVAVRLTPTHR